VSRGPSDSSGDEQLFTAQAFDAAAAFGRRAPLEVEIGSGKARFLIESAHANPSHDFLGLERSLSYYRLCRARLARAALPNVRILRADASLFVTALPPRSVHAFHVYFPDPWPKKRQRKRRLLDGVFLELMADALEPGGLLRIQTDHPDYGATLKPVLESVPALERLEWESVPSPPPTHYEIKYRAEGRPIWRFLLRRREN